MNPTRTPSNRSQSVSDDDAVRATNDDAATAKLSAVNLGYWSDPFISLFVKRTDKKIPLIHRGYYARVTAVHSILKQFMAVTTETFKQVVVLGAGFDTSYWLLKLAEQRIRWYEVDFEAVVMRKAAAIHRQTPLKTGLRVSEDEPDAPYVYKNDGQQVHTNRYHLISGDLRQWDQLKAKLAGCDFDPSLPTLVLSECVLIYLPPENAAEIIRWAGSLPQSIFVNYEQILPNDAFGVTMVSNLELRQCALLGIQAVPDLEAQRQRFLSNGFAHAHALDMIEVYSAVVQGAERTRIERIERFDEMEEWDIMLRHYCFSWAVTSQPSAFADIVLRPSSR
ncbi:hypothetical protein CAOG_08757 [Capsaspora owczarzaki ATCC 30864]|uniref:Leucine carboxyl methyltransferase 1 n=1 Tax=Capsaspora owczarzaki (strain ATCC 30864) TaxID=595528 RepID=A0A0D2WPI9_CAPO3|nr:hypothetical protein CAOG_08757 [Capsaspora owczarzaki ATCC 30864]KJE93325.1 hypothetical protein CAOG_008757 [Capsaspora owczarzaki ATCC 30864]|eukprot:XP_011270387.1 hypothetical protein CAOG_08757 [Capsaspora owczarzaki ATCC 30864]